MQDLSEVAIACGKRVYGELKKNNSFCPHETYRRQDGTFICLWHDVFWGNDQESMDISDVLAKMNLHDFDNAHEGTDGLDYAYRFSRLGGYPGDIDIETEANSTDISIDPEWRFYIPADAEPLREEEKTVKEEDTPRNSAANKLEVKTELGVLIAKTSGDPEYPGFYISLKPDGHAYDIVVALAEVIKAENAREGEAMFHLRPWASSEINDADENGMRIDGRISHDAPMGDIALSAEDFKHYQSVLAGN